MRISTIIMLALAAILGISIRALGSPVRSETSLTTTINPYRALIFREVDLDGLNSVSESPLPRDSGLTVAEQIEKFYSAEESRGVDPAAYIKMTFWDDWSADRKLEEMGSDEQAMNQPHPFDHIFEQQRISHNLTTAKRKLNSMFKKSRQPARSLRDFQAIRLGASLLPHETLATNINSYVPDGFNDGEIVHMFELNEALRTGEKSLNATELAETNVLLLDLYLRALSGLKGPVEIEPSSEQGVEECPICKDMLNAEPAFNLIGCGHKFHIDCATSWMRDKLSTKCPLCHQRFRQALDIAQAQ